MSFKLFMYYCALCGGWAGLFAWVFANPVSLIRDDLLENAFIGAILGLLVTAAIAGIDALINDTGAMRFIRVGVNVALGVLGSFVCALVGWIVLERVTMATAGQSADLAKLLGGGVRVLTWVVVGIVIGLAIGMYDLSRALLSKHRLRFAISKIMKASVGGAIGGCIGGLLLAVCEALEFLRYSKRAVGFVVLGMSIGLLIGVAQVILREAWIRVERGFRPGRELMLVKEETSIGRAEDCDLGLFGDNNVERRHARILFKDDRYMLYDESTPAGTYLNDQRISGPTPLRSGDVIRVGRNVLIFGERQKRPA